MVVKISVGDNTYSIRIDDDNFQKLIQYLRRAGLRFDPATKTWIGDALYIEPPAELVAKVPELAKLPRASGRYVANYFIFCGEEPKHLSYTIRRYKRVTCDEYCEEKAYTDYDVCVERCEDEGWNPVLAVEETIKLYWRDDRRPGCWHVPRGLVHKLNVEPPPFNKSIEVDTSDAYVLREYQREVVKSVFDAFKKYGGAIAQMATGAGKSYMAGYIAKKLANMGYTVYLTALGVDLITQLRDFAAVHDADMNKVKAVTIQKLYRQLTGKSIDSAEIREAFGEDEIAIDENGEEDVEIDIRERNVAVIIDEVHHVPARTVKEVVKEFGGGWALRLGLSATPWRNDGRDLEVEAWVGPIVEPRITSSFLIEHGYLVPVEINIVKAPTCINDERDSWSSIRRSLVKCEERNRYIVELAQQAPKPVLVLTPLVSHAKLLHEMMPGSELATGEVSPTQRKEIFDKIRRGTLDVLVATTIANEGLDLPPLRSMINALGGKSKTMTLQRVGRVVRPWPGKDHAVVYDICDDVKYFRDHCQERIKLYQIEPAWRVVIS